MTYHWLWIVCNAVLALLQLWFVTFHDGWFWFYVMAWPYFVCIAGYWVGAYFDDRQFESVRADLIRIYSPRA